MTDTHTPVFIEGRDIVLRPVLPADHNARVLSWLNDPETSRYSRRRFLPTADAGGYASSRDVIHLAICLREDARHVGNISLGPINWPHRFAEISILLGDRSVWNRGIASQAIYLLARHALVTFGLNRVEAGSANPAFNRAVVEKLGWREEGRKRRRFFLDGEWLDVVMTSQLRDEFRRRPEYEAAP